MKMNFSEASKMGKYSPKVDLVFRKLFGSEENKEILLSLINAVLNYESKIKEIEIKNPYNISSYITGKSSILDIKGVDENGTWYDIEMQLGEQGFYGKRALYYWGKVYTDQIDERGAFFNRLKKTIGIHLLDFNYFNDERYYRKILLKDDETNEAYDELDYVELHFVEMNKFDNELANIKTVLDRWIVFMNKAYELEENMMPKELMDEKEIVDAVRKLEIMYFDKEERRRYEAEKNFKLCQEEEFRTAREKGMQKGIEKGKRQIIKNAINKGFDIKEIIELTGCSEDDVSEIMQELEH
jgi:predicted transposase/invertase (TIGR01784 family)